MKKFDIRKTFDIFLREPISVLTEGLFQLVNIENNIFNQKPYVNVDFVNRKTQITVVNSEKMYNLFQKVLFKRKLKELTKLSWSINLDARIKKINQTFPMYKYIKHMILTDEELIKTTTKKIKRKEELDKILSKM